MEREIHIISEILETMIRAQWKEIRGANGTPFCRYCGVEESGYYGNRSWDHKEWCPVELKEQLSKLLREEK